MADNVPSQSVLTAHLQGEAVLLEMDRKRYFRLNETGQAIWRALEDGGDEDAVVDALLASFDVDETTARAEIHRFIQDLTAQGLVRPAGDRG